MENIQVAELLLSQTCVYKDGRYRADSEVLKGSARRLCDKSGEVLQTRVIDSSSPPYISNLSHLH